MHVSWAESGKLTIREAAAPVESQRRGIAAEPAIPAHFLQSPGVSLEKTLEISLAPEAETRRGEALPVIALDVETVADEAPFVILRHPSGAITFHPSSIASAGRRGMAAAPVHQFRIPVRQAQTATGRRGIVTSTIKAVVLKVTKPVIDKVVDFVLPKLAQAWEERSWSKHGLQEGWFQVMASNGSAIRLEKAVPNSSERNLLLIHGTFSNAASGYGGLTQTDFFEKAKAIYGDRIFAFNHFTVSRSPQENVNKLLSDLPDRKQSFDVITHSRGGLVLRNRWWRMACPRWWPTSTAFSMSPQPPLRSFFIGGLRMA